MGDGPGETALPVVEGRTGRPSGSWRPAPPNCFIHRPSGGFEGLSGDVEIHAREVLSLRASVDELYARHTGQEFEHVHADMERDRYFKGAEAVAYGLSTG